MAAEREGISANGNEVSFGDMKVLISVTISEQHIEYTKNHPFIYTLRVNLMVCAYISKAVILKIGKTNQLESSV